MKRDQNESTLYIITFDSIREKIFIKTSLITGQPLEFLHSSRRGFSRVGRLDELKACPLLPFGNYSF